MLMKVSIAYTNEDGEREYHSKTNDITEEYLASIIKGTLKHKDAEVRIKK